MQGFEWVLGGAALAAVATVWAQARGLIQYFTSFAIVRHELDMEAAYALIEYCNANWKTGALGTRTYGANHWPMRKTRQHHLLMYERLFLNSVFWKGWAIMRVGGPNNGSGVSVTFIRGTIDFRKLLIDSAIYFTKLKQSSEMNSRFRVTQLGGTWSIVESQYKNNSSSNSSKSLSATPATDGRMSFDLLGLIPLGWHRNEVGLDGSGSCRLDDLALSTEATEILGAIDWWFKNRQWHHEKRVPWKLGVRLVGEPGCGKTRFICGVAHRYDLPIFMLDLATMTNDDLRDAWKTAMQSTPCAIVVEDIDAVFVHDKPVHKDIPLTLDTLRQCMDGLQQHDGVLIFITTNKPETLDPSLKRAGRTDFELEMLPPSDEGRRKIAERICGDWPELVEELIETREVRTGAEFQQMCRRAAQRTLLGLAVSKDILLDHRHQEEAACT